MNQNIPIHVREFLEKKDKYIAIIRNSKQSYYFQDDYYFKVYKDYRLDSLYLQCWHIGFETNYMLWSLKL